MVRNKVRGAKEHKEHLSFSLSSEVAARHLVAQGAIVARPISDPGMDLRDIEVQTLAGRSLPLAVETFLTMLCDFLQ